ncbi:hypothetical protein JW756_05605 [Candidatus Woesearchaeota archaeon]|nr:hypothetical protein [Candidatus Woesearchaeota archaeon]
MPKIITVKYESDKCQPLWKANPEMAGFATRFLGLQTVMDVSVCEDAEETIRNAMDLLAAAYKKHSSQADFGIIDSDDLTDLCFSNQCFYEKYLEESLQKQGIADVTAYGSGGGRYEVLLEEIKKFGSEIEYLDNIKSANSPVLYRFERR